ncbi:MAG: hypothetical protein ACTS73_05105 [Arsenophonus sp. NEOnobi-MAG3]
MKSLPYRYPKNQILSLMPFHKLILNGARQLIATVIEAEFEAMLQTNTC